MHILKDPSFFLMNNIRAPQDEELGNTYDLLITNDDGVVQPQIIESVPIVFPSAGSVVYLVSKSVGMMPLRRLNSVDVRLLSARKSPSFLSWTVSRFRQYNESTNVIALVGNCLKSNISTASTNIITTGRVSAVRLREEIESNKSKRQKLDEKVEAEEDNDQEEAKMKMHMKIVSDEKRYPLTPATITDMLNMKLQADHWNEMCYQLLKLMQRQQKKK
nr:hypothetical protein [Tanacetum cinerariifolium]